MLIADELAGRRELIASAPELAALLANIRRRNSRAIAEAPPLPETKALLSVDGGRCEDCGGALVFDPWSPRVHRCSRCSREHGGTRHDRAWARWQHLWLAGRAAETAALAVLAEDAAAGARARTILAAYGERYLDYPNQDNVLGPARLFFSTYLESIWLTDYLAAAHLLREGGLLDDDTAEAVNRVADEAANLIGDFDEGFSNRQTWHDAALLATAVWFEDEDLANRAIQGETGLVAHLLHGFGADGLWYEGENYHLFALRGLLTGFGWARLAGVEAFDEPALRPRLVAALRAPALTALPDLTFPARRDARFGVSLAQPMYLELWEVGLARLHATAGDTADAGHAGIADWLASLYASAAPPAGTFDSYLHEAGAPATARDRTGLSWWSLLEMLPELDGDAGAWAPGSILFEGQGLAVLRRGRRYASLECGTTGGGHGHPDRLHLTLHDSGVHWLADPGAGSYVTRDLFWYRSTLAHNAPRIDGRSQTPGEAHCEYFDAGEDWAWARGRWDRTSRTLVAGPGYLLDLVELEGPDPHLLELPWHLPGEHTVRSGRWEPVLDDPLAAVELVSDVERFTPSRPGVITVDVRTADGASLTLHLAGVDELLRARGPGLPDTGAIAPSGPGKAPFLVARSRGSYVRMTALITSGAAELAAVQGDLIEVRHDGVAERHHRTTEGWDVELADATVHLAGRRAAPRRPEPLFDRNRELEVQGAAAWIEEAPALDGSLDGFDLSSPLHLDHDDQYRRSEEPYAGPESFSAEAWVNWNDAGLYLAVDVTTSDVVLRAPDAPPLLLDNERDEIHSAGIQVYLRSPEHGSFLGLLVVPVPGTSEVRVLPVDGTAADADVGRGGWELTDGGYRITLAIEPPEWSLWYAGNEVAFDLLVNEMRPGRDRRSGQLVWSGGGGWVWLRGDRHDPARLRTLVLQ